jgi:choline-glycine betaine transporter
MHPMTSLHNISGAVYLSQIFTSIFLAILFLQSGVDKLVDRRGNLQWLTGHFAQSPLAKLVPLLLLAITLLELAAGALSAIGAIDLMFSHESLLAFWGACVAAIAILCLFFGQRMAKEYAGAAILVPYFILTIVAIILLAHGQVLDHA